jgi:hypothetical protein
MMHARIGRDVDRCQIIDAGEHFIEIGVYIWSLSRSSFNFRRYVVRRLFVPIANGHQFKQFEMLPKFDIREGVP